MTVDTLPKYIARYENCYSLIIFLHFDCLPAVSNNLQIL